MKEKDAKTAVGDTKGMATLILKDNYKGTSNSSILYTNEELKKLLSKYYKSKSN